MPLEPGARLGPYEVTGRIGEGGMGEVYRAHDSRVGRDVALKTLPASFAGDADRLMRFEREARAVAALNHPNICALYDVGPDFLVMELVEGPTLEERIYGVPGLQLGAPGLQPRGTLSVDEALAIARQIASALAAAHEAGIVHRDLKPANIKVKEDGTVKVLDFGLAKAHEARRTQHEAPSTSTEHRAPSTEHVPPPTMLSPAMTEIGVILGTAAYMSPEQARGRPVDRRADIWAFGVILYEMLTGRRLFGGETVSDTIAAVLREAPDLGLVPPGARRAVAACLERDPKKRLRDIGDFPLLVEPAEGTTAGSQAPAERVGRGWVFPGLAALGAAVALTLAVLHFGEARPAPPEPLTFEIGGETQHPAIAAVSPDGRTILYATRAEEGLPRQLWVRSFASRAARAVPASEGFDIRLGAWSVAAWSPDSRSVAFTVGNALRRVDTLTGQSTALVASSGLLALVGPGAWNRDGTILYGIRSLEIASSGVWRVAETGGEPVQVTTIRGGERAHFPSAFLPDGRRFLYFVEIRGFDTGGEVRIGSLDTAPESQDDTPLLSAEGPATYAAGRDGAAGHIFFVSRASLWAQRFDPDRGVLEGPPTQLASGVGSSFSASSNGHVAYRGASTDAEPLSELVRFDHTGRRLDTIGPPAGYGEVQRLADGRRLAVSRTDAGEPSHVHIVDIAREVFMRLNPGSVGDLATAPAHDDLVAFTHSPEVPMRDVYVRAATGVGDARLLVTSDTVKHPNDWSPDGRFLMYDDHVPGRAQDLLVVTREGGTPIPFLTTEADETFGQFSPDGRWIAYRSTESGRPEIYIRDFEPDRSPAYGGEKVQISGGGGDKPRWSPDGRQIYFLADDDVMAVPVRPGRPFEVGTPVRLFQTRWTSYYPYVVMPDGTFIFNTPIERPQAATPPIVVLFNWEAVIARR